MPAKRKPRLRRLVLQARAPLYDSAVPGYRFVSIESCWIRKLPRNVKTVRVVVEWRER